MSAEGTGSPLIRLEARRRIVEQRPSHSARTASILGIALGVCFSVCFLTGLLSHLIQHPPAWFHWPPRPAGLYRLSQGLHVATGVAAVPLLLAKLYAVYPKFWQWPPLRSVGSAIERATLLPLVAGSLFLLFSGVNNIDLWYPYHFFFPAAHRSVAWITMGALAVHVGYKAATARTALAPVPAAGPPSSSDDDHAVSRRAFIGAAAAGSGILLATTVGQTVAPLSRVGLLAPRAPHTGAQGLSVNKTAAAAGVLDAARSSDYRLTVGRGRAVLATFTLDELRALPQHRATLPIACVEGWSVNAAWTGVRVRDLLERAGAGRRAVRVESMQRGGRYRASELTADQAHDPDTLLALLVNGEPLHLDHGYPVRLISPNRPGVLQTKWVAHLEVR